MMKKRRSLDLRFLFIENMEQADGFGGKDNRKENRQGCLSNLITTFHNIQQKL